jgi:hypothetical protein
MGGLEQAMTRKYKKLPVLGLSVLISLSCTSSVIAADVAGHSTGTQEVISSLPLRDGLTATRVSYHVGVVTDAQEGLFHGGTQQCLASIVQNADGSTVEGHGACDGIDPDGDVWWISIAMEGDAPINWTITGGTGKYEGLAMSGVTSFLAQHADGIFVGRFEGDYDED